MNININLHSDNCNTYTESLELNLLKVSDGRIRLTVQDPDRVFEVSGEQLLQAVSLLQSTKE